MDYRNLDSIPESFYAETKKMCENNEMDFFYAEK